MPELLYVNYIIYIHIMHLKYMQEGNSYFNNKFGAQECR
jgi:hypothetical protein